MPKQYATSGASGRRTAYSPGSSCWAGENAIDVALYWHQWKLGGGVDAPAAGNTPAARPGLMEQIGQALIAGARAALLQ